MSWWELREFLKHECHDERSALFRQINPDAESVDRFLLRHVAQATTDLRWLTAAPLFDEVPEGFQLREFPFPGEAAAKAAEAEARAAAEAERVERARAAAAEIRAG